MIDYLSLALSHGVLLLAFWRLMQRDDLDTEQSDEGSADAPESDTQPRKGLRRA